MSYQQPFTFLPGIWSNFGVLTNFTYVKSQLDYLAPPAQGGGIIATRDLLNLSQNAYNAVFYYEDEMFAARLAGSYRSGYTTNVPGRDGNDLEGTHKTFNLDASASYQVSDDLKLVLEALNLTDEVIDQWVDQTADRPSFYHESGKQYYIGARL